MITVEINPKTANPRLTTSQNTTIKPWRTSWVFSDKPTRFYSNVPIKEAINILIHHPKQLKTKPEPMCTQVKPNFRLYEMR